MSREETQTDRINNLVKIGCLKPADRDDASIAQYLANAGALLQDAGSAGSPLGRFLLAYEGIHCVALAFLEHLGVRPGDGEGHRMNALQIAVQEMGIENTHPGALRTVIDLHRMRNDKIYRRPYPPVSKAAADATVRLLSAVLPEARRVIGPLDESMDSPPSIPRSWK
jgi:hypothetical protein